MQFKTETKVGIFILVAVAVFAYMVFYLGIFKVNLSKYNSYNIYFDDLSGLVKKSDVKIAGVRVGWVDTITLVEGGSKARVKVLVNKNFMLHADAHAEIRQEGLLGSKYLEIIPGSGISGDLLNGSTLYREGKSVVSMEDLLRKVKNITENIEAVSEGLRGAIGNDDQRNELKVIIQNISKASEKIAAFTDVLSKNDSEIDSMIKDLSAFSHKLDKDFSRVIDGVESLTKHIGSVAQKIDEGEGFIGQLINDTEVFDDIKTVASTLRATAETAGNAELLVDSHWESMYRPAEFYPIEDSKGYLEMRLHTSEDKFYLLQFMSSIKGRLDRRIEYYDYIGTNQDPLYPIQDERTATPYFQLQPQEAHIKVRVPNAFKFGLQFGKIFGDIALRFGFFENFAGAAVDYEIPFKSDKFRWVTTFEAFDFRGQDRIDDLRPHFKWINRVFILRNLYLAFGADDFISRRNANAFFGGGLRFNDDDLKNLLSSLGFVTGFLK